MPIILDLYVKADLLVKEIEKHLDEYHLEKKKLSSIEDSLVETRECLLLVREEIRLHENANDFKSLIDENREAEIASFRERLSSLLLKNK